MDTVGDDAWKSVRLAWEAERWLPAGVPVAGIAFLLWVGVTGAAVGFLAELVVGPVSVDPWTGTTDVVAVVLFLCWIVAPAAVATWLVRDRLTTVRGTLEIGYRLHHPVLLLVPPLAVLAIGALALVGLGTAPVPVLALLVAGSLWFLVRTVAYSYRVFTFSVPVLTHAMALLTACLLAGATLVTGARLVGQGPLVETIATTLATRTDSPAVLTLVGGTVDLAGVAVPALAATVIGVPLALGAAYVAVQGVASVLARLLKPTVRRPELRSGQRYPEFARPTTDVSPAPAPGGSQPPSTPPAPEHDGAVDPPSTPDESSDAEPAGATAEESEPTETDADDTESDADLSNTRVFTAADDAPSVSPTAVDPAEECPACGAPIDPDSASRTCPDCGVEF